MLMFVSDTIIANGLFTSWDNGKLIRNAVAVAPEPSAISLGALAVLALLMQRHRRLSKA